MNRERNEIHNICQGFAKEMVNVADVENLFYLKDKVRQELGDQDIFFWSEIARTILLHGKTTKRMALSECCSF